jgi:hypothetical protein
MKIIIFYIPIFLCIFSCENPNTKKINDSAPAIGDSKQKDANVISKKFISQTFINKSSDSFGQTTKQFFFDNNGKGTFYLAWTVGSKFYEHNGDLNWVIEDGKVYVRYLYLASDGVSSNEEEVFFFNEEKNELIDENNSSQKFKSISKEKEENNYHDEEIPEFDEAEYNRQQEDAERQSSIAYYSSKKILEKVSTFIECGCGAHDCVIVFIDDEGNVHEFIQSDIADYDFGCPRNVRYLKTKFRIKYEVGYDGYEKLISISQYK